MREHKTQVIDIFGKSMKVIIVLELFTWKLTFHYLVIFLVVHHREGKRSDEDNGATQQDRSITDNTLERRQAISVRMRKP